MGVIENRLLEPSSGQDTVESIGLLEARVAQSEMDHLGSVRVGRGVHDGLPHERRVEAAELRGHVSTQDKLLSCHARFGHPWQSGRR